LTLGGCGLCQRGRGEKIIESVEGWSKSHFLACFGHISMKIMLKVNREQRKKNRKISVLSIKKHRSAAVRGRAGASPPPGSACEFNEFSSDTNAM